MFQVSIKVRFRVEGPTYCNCPTKLPSNGNASITVKIMAHKFLLRSMQSSGGVALFCIQGLGDLLPLQGFSVTEVCVVEVLLGL